VIVMFAGGFTPGRRSAAVITAILVAGLAGCGSTVAPGPGGGASSSAPAATSPAPAATSPAPAATSPAPPATPPSASAAAQLAGFFAAAQLADARLKRAAALVNEGIGTTSMSFSPAALAAVNALDPTPAARAIPAGLPAEMLRRVLLVYSELESRNASLRSISRSGYSSGSLPISGQEGSYISSCLGNGAPAAARFGADLAAARALAEAIPPVTVAAPDSRAAAELAVRIAFINGWNSGCDSCGGGVLTTLATVIWQREHVSGDGYSDGTINGLRFSVSYHAGSGWQAMLFAC
jgi:hypothetical protein